jgi:hypothetical protein
VLLVYPHMAPAPPISPQIFRHSVCRGSGQTGPRQSSAGDARGTVREASAESGRRLQVNRTDLAAQVGKRKAAAGEIGSLPIEMCSVEV